MTMAQRLAAMESWVDVAGIEPLKNVYRRTLEAMLK